MKSSLHESHPTPRLTRPSPLSTALETARPSQPSAVLEEARGQKTRRAAWRRMTGYEFDEKGRNSVDCSPLGA